jgi:cell division topological specificity factor
MFNGFLQKVMGKSDSKDVAKRRLKFALIYDKLEISDDTLENLHRDIVEVISRYFEIDQKGFKLDIRRSDDFSALVVNTPILSAKHKEYYRER